MLAEMVTKVATLFKHGTAVIVLASIVEFVSHCLLVILLNYIMPV